jgi:hypothetical protein
LANYSICSIAATYSTPPYCSRLNSSLLIKAHLGDKYLPVGIGAVAILQLRFTYAPPLQRLFDNQAVPLRVWPRLLAGGLVFFLVVEMEKLVVRSMDRLRCIVTMVETRT